MQQISFPSPPPTQSSPPPPISATTPTRTPPHKTCACAGYLYRRSSRSCLRRRGRGSWLRRFVRGFGVGWVCLPALFPYTFPGLHKEELGFRRIRLTVYGMNRIRIPTPLPRKEIQKHHHNRAPTLVPLRAQILYLRCRNPDNRPFRSRVKNPRSYRRAMWRLAIEEGCEG
jgi:hypothetical protein